VLCKHCCARICAGRDWICRIKTHDSRNFGPWGGFQHKFQYSPAWQEFRAARVAKLADAPDLGLRNHRFQNVAIPFKAERVYEEKTLVLSKSCNSTNGEQEGAHSSTNPSTPMDKGRFESQSRS
jgi:hypothetical protein